MIGWTVSGYRFIVKIKTVDQKLLNSVCDKHTNIRLRSVLRPLRTEHGV